MSLLGDKVKTSIERLRAFAPKDGEGYYLAFSGGKDSVVCKALMDMAGVKYKAFYRVTSVDPPELVRFIREKHPDVLKEIPRYPEGYKNPKLEGKPITMWNLIPEKMMPPTRIHRYCCQMLKESGGDGRMTVTGVRWAESVNRKHNQGAVTIFGKKVGRELTDDSNFAQTKRGGFVLVNDNSDSRRMVEQCYKRHQTNVNPIIDWEDSEIWQFIREEKIPYCELYDCGYHRLGCIGCPMSGRKRRELEFVAWPKYKDSYLRAFEKLIAVRKEKKVETHLDSWNDPISMFRWWMEYDDIPGQLSLFEEE